jgi:hypothetical protein
LLAAAKACASLVRKNSDRADITIDLLAGISRTRDTQVGQGLFFVTKTPSFCHAAFFKVYLITRPFEDNLYRKTVFLEE